MFGVLGFGMNGALLLRWYKFLDHFFGANSSKKAVVLKVIADQVVYAPVAIVAYFSFASLLQTERLHFHHCTKLLKDKVTSSFITTWIADSSAWPAVNFLNFRFVPIHYRPTVTGMASVAWQAYMSFVSYRHSTDDDDDDDVDDDDVNKIAKAK